MMRLYRLFLILFLLLLPISFGFGQDVRPIVKVVYFIPNDREAQSDIDTKLDTLIKNMQQFFADEMERHGFGRKTFEFETDENGNAKVHHVNGEFDEAYYNENSWRALIEIARQLDTLKDIYFLMLEVGSWVDENGKKACIPGRGITLNSTPELGGTAILPAFGDCFGWDKENGLYFAAHEIGHALGLEHDFRGPPHLMSYTFDAQGKKKLSRCAAEWLTVHRAFNPAQVVRNAPLTLKMLPAKVVAAPNKIRLRFEITDADGLHQAQVFTLINTLSGTKFSLITCKRLDGTTPTIVEFDTTYLTPNSTFVYLKVIDKRGNFAFEMFEIDVKSLLPPPKSVMIPDVNLAAAIRKQIGDPITTHTMLNLKSLNVNNSDITDLTGLEHAHHLIQLSLSDNDISDVSPLSQLAQLRYLYLVDNNISDVSPLSQLPQLTYLYLGDNNISDVSPLSQLIQLTTLGLGYNSISDVSPLEQLTQLTTLLLNNNSISDVSPLSHLPQLTYLWLSDNSISDVSSLSHLTQLTTLGLIANPLSYASIHLYIPAIEANGVNELIYDNIEHPTLVKISGNTQESEVSRRLPLPFIVEAQDDNGVPMRDVSVMFTITVGGGQLSNTTTTTDANGRAQTYFTLGHDPGKHVVTATAITITTSVLTFTVNATVAQRIAEDINKDGVVNIIDIILIIGYWQKIGESIADVNGDGVVNIDDLILVANAIKENEAVAPIKHPSTLQGVTAAKILSILTHTRKMASTNPDYVHSVAVLEQLLMLLMPKKTALLANYPNPFNPETWIPYHLAKDADVTLRIYSANGQLVRTLALGHQHVGMYQSRNRAAYWDGKNATGEPVASGVYFYTLTAGEFSATRKMLIWK